MNPHDSRLKFMAHAFFCQEGCRVATTYTTYQYDSSPTDERVDQPIYWRTCQVGTKLREEALNEDPSKD